MIMVNYRRVKTGNPDDYYFLTIVTANRAPWIEHHNLFKFIKSKLATLANGYKAKISAWVILPDHIHLLIRPGKSDYSNIVKAFKRGVGAECKERKIIETGDKLWQDRFWEETIKDEAHYWNCVEYIHYNPVKHGYAESAAGWGFSSFHGYVRDGIYPGDWGEGKGIEIKGAEFD